MIKKGFVLASIIYFFNSVANVSQGVLIKHFQGELSVGVYEMIAIKCLVAALIMLPFSIKYLIRKDILKKTHIVILLAFLYSLDLLCCNTGFKTVPINTGTLILLLIPLWIVVFGRVILKEKSFNKVNAFALVVCLIAVFIPIRSEISFGGFNSGYIFLFMASIIIPLGLILQKRFTDCRPVSYALFTNAVILGIISFILSVLTISFTAHEFTISIDAHWLLNLNAEKIKAGLLVAICDLVEFAAVYVAYQMTEAALLQPIRFTRILISIALSWIILAEAPTTSQIISAILIISANALSIWYSRKYQNEVGRI